MVFLKFFLVFQATNCYCGISLKHRDQEIVIDQSVNCDPAARVFNKFSSETPKITAAELQNRHFALYLKTAFLPSSPLHRFQRKRMLSPALLMNQVEQRRNYSASRTEELRRADKSRRGSNEDEEKQKLGATKERRPSLLLLEVMPNRERRRSSGSIHDFPIESSSRKNTFPVLDLQMFSKTSTLLSTATQIKEHSAAKEIERQRRRQSSIRRESIALGPKANISTHQYTEDPTVAWEMLREKRPVKPVRQMKLDTPVKMDHVRFVCIACTHGNRIDPARIPAGDVLLVGGDFTSCGLPKEVHNFNKNLGQLKHAYKVLVAGNHECTFDETFLRKSSLRETEAKELALKQALQSALHSCKLTSPKPLLTNGIYLEDEIIELFGITIYGTPWQPKADNWAFNLSRGQALLDKWNLIPPAVDVLLTHTPPLGHGDQMHSGQRMGCVELLNSVTKRIKPKYHVFGHIHEGYGCTSDGYTKFINCCQCDQNLEWKNEPVIFDIQVAPQTKQFYLQNAKKITKRFCKKPDKK